MVTQTEGAMPDKASSTLSQLIRTTPSNTGSKLILAQHTLQQRKKRVCHSNEKCLQASICVINTKKPTKKNKENTDQSIKLVIRINYNLLEGQI